MDEQVEEDRPQQDHQEGQAAAAVDDAGDEAADAPASGAADLLPAAATDVVSDGEGEEPPMAVPIAVEQATEADRGVSEPVDATATESESEPAAGYDGSASEPDAAQHGIGGGFPVALLGNDLTEEEDYQSNRQSTGSLPEHQHMPVRQYLESTVVPVLRQGLRALVKTRPQNPLEFLADYLKNNQIAA
eukprot:jgi/Chlat1/5151/Chrsp33S05030